MATCPARARRESILGHNNCPENLLTKLTSQELMPKKTKRQPHPHPRHVTEASGEYDVRYLHIPLRIVVLQDDVGSITPGHLCLPASGIAECPISTTRCPGHLCRDSNHQPFLVRGVDNDHLVTRAPVQKKLRFFKNLLMMVRVCINDSLVSNIFIPGRILFVNHVPQKALLGPEDREIYENSFGCNSWLQ